MAATDSRMGRRRRAVSEINMVPFIDVMLVLLIIFMVTAPMLSPAMIDVPRVIKANRQPPVVLQMVVEKNQHFRVKEPGGKLRDATINDLVAAAQAFQEKNAAHEGGVAIVISADRNATYESVIQLMSRLQAAGIERVGLAVEKAN